jgi:hypothetical protein
MTKHYVWQDGKCIPKVYIDLPHPQAALLQDWIDGMDIQFRDENGEWINMPRALDYFTHDLRAVPDASHESRISQFLNAELSKEHTDAEK